MKILNRYILKSFLVPFLATFLIILFVLVMQTLWLQFDKIAGKGIDLTYIMKFLGYLAQMQIPLALPIAILLSSIMALGTLAENYEFAAVKSAGISLRTFIRPLVILMLLLSGLNFLFLNYAFPRAAFKFKNMLLEMQKTQPALALIPGTFNTDIPGYSIKFAEKYGENDDQLKDVLIYYDLDRNRGNNKVISADRGQITTDEGSKYMTLKLFDGYNYQALDPANRSYKESLKMPFAKSHFDEYTINIDISELQNVNLNEYKQDREMLSLKQLSYYTDSLKPPYDEYIKTKAHNFLLRAGITKIAEVDSVELKGLSTDILSNYDSITKGNIIVNATSMSTTALDDIKGYTNILKNKQKLINVYNTEYHRRLAYSLACLVLFFIGAPLGSIIRKGGFGFPMILAIVIFVIYYFISTFGKNMAQSSSITAVLGGWLSTLILLPFGLFLMRRATQDKGIFNVDLFLQPITNFFRKLFRIKTTNTDQQ
ncbi:MAG: LptF/LptG family permease [Flavobacteriaceae bacterium]|nr:LptF/LptG family permease [Flavobacteriaceae bacterium]